MKTITTSLFSLREETTNSQKNQTEQAGVLLMGRTPYEHGYEDCRDNLGSIKALEICLHRIFANFREECKQDNTLQDELKEEFRQKLEVLKGENPILEKRIESIKGDNIAPLNSKIHDSQERIRDIKANPNQITKERLNKVGFIIGLVITVFLTGYLFLFYSSATYSAFFKEFTRNDIGIASSIFDPKAIQKAYSDGTFELALIVLAPFIFLGLGFLMHKFSEKRDALDLGGKIWNYTKVILLLAMTLAFDLVIAFKITQEIYKLNMTLTDPTMHLDWVGFQLAFHKIEFWIIIFAGFVTYMILGLVFSFTLEEYEKMDAVNIAIQNEYKKIEQYEKDKLDYEKTVDSLNKQVLENKKRINEYQATVHGGLIRLRDFEPILFEFMSGWMNCISKKSFGDDLKVEANKFAIEFLDNIKTGLEQSN